MNKLKELWQLWIDFTEFRAIRACYIDEVLWGNSVKVRKWWGWKHIPYLEFCQSETITTKEAK